MTTREDFTREFWEVTKQVHELLTDPLARKRFRRMRMKWHLPKDEDARVTKVGGRIHIRDKYVWLGIPHDWCYPDEPIFPKDATEQVNETTSILALLNFDREKGKRQLEAFLVDVRADLEKNVFQKGGAARTDLDNTSRHDTSAAKENVPEAAVPTNINIQNSQVILGDVTGSTITQNVKITVREGDLKSLLDFLASKDVPRTDLDDLESAISSDPKPLHKGNYGPQVTAWLGRMAGGAWQIGQSAAGSLLAYAITQYYGL